MADALENPSTSPQLVKGFLVAARNQPYRLCEALAESFPPQCGRPALRVDDLELEEIPGLEYARGVTWSPKPLELIGIVREGTLVIEEPHQ